MRLVRQEPRAGKSAALNRGVAAARGDVLVFTDANALFAPDALAALVAPFADPRVGVVSGQGLYGSIDGDARVVSGGYMRYEALIRSGESALGFLASADGAIYAMRRDLYRDLEPNEVNDLPASDPGRSRRCAVALRRRRPTPSSRRRPAAVRSSVGTCASSRRACTCSGAGCPALIAQRRWRAVWMLLSHRVLRWTTAPALLTVLVANVLLLERGRPLHRRARRAGDRSTRSCWPAASPTASAAAWADSPCRTTSAS